MTCSSQGRAAGICLDDTAIDTNSQALHFTSETLSRRQPFINDGSQSIRGTRFQPKERVSPGLKLVQGSIVCNPTPSELDYLFPWILGGTPTGDTFPLAEELTDRLVCVDLVAKVMTFSGCKVGRAVFQGQTGSPIQLRLDLVGVDETVGNAGTFPAVTYATDRPYMFNQAVVNLDSSARVFQRFAYIIDNHLDVKHNNSLTATHICSTYQSQYLMVDMPFTSDEVDIYTTNDTDVTGAAGSLVLTDGGVSTTFTFANLKLMPETPIVSGKTEIRMPSTYEIFSSGATLPVVVTHDATP